jgi:PAS domain S-box-containing protein
MSVARQFRDGVKCRVNILFQNTIFRYLFSIVAVASVFALRIWFIPLTGTGAPFVLFFAAVLVTSLFAGVGPGICAVLLSIPLAAHTFVMGAGYSIVQTSFQSLLFAVDGIVVVYLTFLTKKGSRSFQNANRQVRESEEALRRTQALNQAVLGSLAATIAVLDREGNIIAVNEAWKRFAKENGGAAVADSVGVNYLQVCRDASGSRDGGWAALNGIQSVLDGTLHNFVLEYPCHSPSEKRWFLMSVTPLHGEPGGTVVTHSDITKRKQIEEALQESEKRLELAMDAGGIGTFDWNVRTNEVVWAGQSKNTGPSEAFRGVYGEWAKRVRREDLLVCEAGIQEVFRKKCRHWQAEYRMMSSDTAEERWINSQGHIFYDAQGEPLRMIGVNIDITESKQAEDALRVASAELRQTLHTAATGLIHCSRDLRYISANPAYAQWIGLPVEKIVGRPIVEVMGQAAFEIIRPRIERVLRGERVEYEDELPIAGEFKCTQAVYTPDRDDSGNVVGWVGSVMDITGRKRNEEEIKAANAFLDAIIENIPLMLFIKESQSLRFIRFNRVGEDLLGWPKETLIGKNDYDFWPKEQAEFFIEKDRETLNRGSVIDIPEEPILTRYGGVRILHTKKVPILDTTGKPIYLLGISEDITERQRFEKEQQFLADVSVALSASLEYEQTLGNLARLVAQNIADWCAVDVINEEGQLSRLKVATADPDQTALCTVLEEMPPDRDLPHLMQSVIESKRPVVVEQVTLQYIESLAQAPGHLQALLATGVRSFVVVPLLMRGQPLGALFLGSSTLSRVFGQGDLHLAEALAERAAMAIENARLYRSSVHATQLRDQVLGVVAHDLRNPLSTILLQISSVRRQDPAPERRFQKPLEVIQRAAERMNRLIQDLLDVALMEAGQLTIERARLSAGELIGEAVDMQRPLASSSSLELRVEVAPDVAEVWGDRDRLLQVFENLIGNAIKFTQAGGCITAGATSRDDEVVFWVADTGDGIASENLPRIFDRFWQASRAGRRGAGFGLSITKAIVEAHGGRIWVESTSGSGSTFFFTIPRTLAAQDRLSNRRRSDDRVA